MNILIPMAGAGSRFANNGYTTHKPFLPITCRHGSGQVPMVVEAVNNLPVDLDDPATNLVFILRDFHVKDGANAVLMSHFPRAQFIVVDNLTDGQARTCLLARDVFSTHEPLIIAACDNGIDVSYDLFTTQALTASALIFTFRGNEAVLQKPQAYGWVKTDGTHAIGVSIKKPISDDPLTDHTVVGTFWFKHGHDFFTASDQMIAAKDLINGEYYVDQVFKYMIDAGQDVQVTEVDHFLCWGTPEDYKAYEATLAYWTKLVAHEEWAK